MHAVHWIGDRAGAHWSRFPVCHRHELPSWQAAGAQTQRWPLDAGRPSEAMCCCVAGVMGAGLSPGPARFRRLAKDYERLPETLIGLHSVAFVCLLLQKAGPLL